MWPEKGAYFEAPRDDEGSSSSGRPTDRTMQNGEWTPERLAQAANRSRGWEISLQEQEEKGQGTKRIGP